MTKDKKSAAFAITDVRYALLATLAGGPSHFRQINGRWNSDGVVWRTYDQMIAAGLVTETRDCHYHLTDAGQAAYLNAFREREQREPNQIFLLTQDYGPGRIAVAYADFEALKPAFCKALADAARQWFSQEGGGGGTNADNEAWVERKVEKVLASAKAAKTVERLEEIGSKLFNRESDGWLWGAEVFADRIILLTAKAAA